MRVNFEFPEHLHDLFKEFPPCPENTIPDKEQFSQHQQSLGVKITEVKEIVEFDQKDWMAPYIQFKLRDARKHGTTLKKSCSSL